MPKFFVKTNQIEKDKIKIVGEDVKHINQVLRAKIGEELMICNLDTTLNYITTVSQITPEYVICNIQDCVKSFVESNIQVTIFQGLPKADKMELIIQKAVELGAFSVIPVETKRCVVKLDAKKAAKKVARWQQIAESAAKQSKRMLIPEIHEVMTYKEALAFAGHLDVKLIPYELAKGMKETREILNELRPGQSIGIFIGPEGGFEEEEVSKALEAGAHAITLGRRILRTETAGLAILSVLMFQLENE